MYPRNAASPERIAIGAVVQISDGAVQTSGVSIKVKPQGTTASAGGGTTSYEEGIVEYLPTQAETNYTSFEVIAYKTGCIPVATTIVTTASVTPGTVLLAPVTHTSAVVPTVTTLTGHTAQTGDAYARLGAPAGASVSADVAAVKTQTAAIEVDTQDIQGRLPAALVSGRMDASVGAMAANTMTAAAAASDLTTELQSGLATASALATLQSSVDVVDGIVDAILVDTAVIGAAGAGLTAVPWNAAWDAEVQSEVSDGLIAYGAATATDVTTAAANVSVDEIQATALADLFNTNSGTTYASAVAGSVVAEIADNAGGSALTAGAIADAVWDEILSGHAVSGSTGEALSAAGGAGDPWITALPGSYSAGQAGYIIGTNINATISSRATQTSVDTIDGIVDSILIDTAEIGAAGAGLTALASASSLATVLADTNELQTDWANGGRLDLILDARASQTSVDDLPTNAELATALASADDAVLTAVADLPTNAELATALGTADDAVLAAIAALSIPTVGDIADAVHDEVVEGTTTLRQSIRLANAALGGKASGLETTAVAYRDLADTKDRITATVDADGNRSVVTRDLT